MTGFMTMCLAGYRVTIILGMAILFRSIFSQAQTVNPPATAGALTNVAAIHLAAGPMLAQAKTVFLTFGLDRVPFLQVTLFSNPLWQYMASLIYLLLAFFLSQLLDYIIQARVKKWAEKTETKFDDYLITLLHGPIKVVTFVILPTSDCRFFPGPTG
jgi:hypothetical protein